MELYEFIKAQICNLTDVEEDDLSPDTPLSELDLVSLDYVSIEVALRKKFGLAVNMAALNQAQVTTLGQFTDYLTAQAK